MRCVHVKEQKALELVWQMQQGVHSNPNNLSNHVFNFQFFVHCFKIHWIRSFMVNEYMLLTKNFSLEAIVKLSQSVLVCSARTWWLRDCKEEGENFFHKVHSFYIVHVDFSFFFIIPHVHSWYCNFHGFKYLYISCAKLAISNEIIISRTWQPIHVLASHKICWTNCGSPRVWKNM